MSTTEVKNYSDVIRLCNQQGRATVAVAVAQDEDVLKAIRLSENRGLIHAILVGKASLIAPAVQALGIEHAEIIDEEDDYQAALLAARLVIERKADILMKGFINSSDFLKAALNAGPKKPNVIMSHLAAFEIPGHKKLLFLTDGGMIINPDLAQKKGILLNALHALSRLGIAEPKVAILAANEKVHPKMQSTVDAQQLVLMRENGEIDAGTIEGPVALDVALSAEAAAHKGIQSSIAGDVDLFLVPNIDAGNIWAKSMIYLSAAQMAGVVLGADYPIVLTSRVETPEGKLYSIALACLLFKQESRHHAHAR